LQISDQTLPVSRKAQREQERENTTTRRKEYEATKQIELNAASKRKRDDVETDPKLKEFLEVMQPASKTKKWVSTMEDEEMGRPPSKIQAIELPDAESDDDYEAVPKRQRIKSPAKPSIPLLSTNTPVEVVEKSVNAEEPLPEVAPSATDDDWLRSRTNRLLDLVDPDKILEEQGGNTVPTETAHIVDPVEQPSLLNDESFLEQDLTPADEPEDKPDPILEEISKNGRLFVRNLPYTATEDDLRNHFKPFGSLEEVC
jgi:multiple RNA-binding domain-containing protein 1